MVCTAASHTLMVHNRFCAGSQLIPHRQARADAFLTGRRCSPVTLSTRTPRMIRERKSASRSWRTTTSACTTRKRSAQSPIELQHCSGLTDGGLTGCPSEGYANSIQESRATARTKRCTNCGPDTQLRVVKQGGGHEQGAWRELIDGRHGFRRFEASAKWM